MNHYSLWYAAIYSLHCGDENDWSKVIWTQLVASSPGSGWNKSGVRLHHVAPELGLWHSAWQQLALDERFRRLKRRSPLGCWSLRKRAGRSFGAAAPLFSLEIVDRSKGFSTQVGFSPLGWTRKFLNEEGEFPNYWLQLCFLLVWLLMLLMVFLIWLLLGNFGLFRRSHKSSRPGSESIISYLCHHRWYLDATLVVWALVAMTSWVLLNTIL